MGSARYGWTPAPALPEGWEWDGNEARSGSGVSVSVLDGRVWVDDLGPYDEQASVVVHTPSAPIEVVRAVLARFG
jgi:hypothetical protein